MDAHGPDFVLVIIALSLAAWVANNWIRARHGFSVSDDWGRNIERRDAAAEGRLEAMSRENEALRQDVAAMRERLGNVERIVTDSGFALTHEIERLRPPATN